MTQRTIRILSCDHYGCTRHYVPDTYVSPAELRVMALRAEGWHARWNRPAQGLRVRLDFCAEHGPLNP